MIGQIGNWLYHYTGTGGNNPWYNFWSGFGSDIGEIAILAGVIQLARKHNCHTKGCWRMGLHPVEGTPFIVCKKHHPAIPSRATAEHIAEAYRNRTRR